MKKIMIIGPGGAGKTTLAKQLSEKFKLPVHHLDQYFWKPGWQEADHREFIDLQYELVVKDTWIIDGNCMRTIFIRLTEADTVIYMDISRWRCLVRAIKRQWQNYGTVRADMPKGCPAHFDKRFFLFLKYIWQYKKRFHHYIHGLQGYIALLKSDVKFYHLKSNKEVEAFKRSLSSPE